MKIGYIFPGQGTQMVGMGKDLYDEFEVVKNIYEKANKILGISLEKLTFDSTQEELNKTKNTQIAIYTMSLAILEILKQNKINPEAVSGLSLGEYTALTNANAFSVEDGLRIVLKRGELMQDLVPEGKWSMAAVIGLEDEKVERACKQALEKGFVKAVNYNCPGQVVISGEKEAVEEAMKIASEIGARKTIELKTSGPFHTEKLKKAAEELKSELKKIHIDQPNIDVIKNLDGKPYDKNEDIVENLSNHMIKPVKFKQSIETMLDMGIDTFVEIGPGKVLSGFVKKVSKEKQKEVNIFNIDNMQTLKNFLVTYENVNKG